MSDRATTVGDLRELLSEYDDDHALKLDADSVRLDSVQIHDEDDAVVLY